MTTTTTTEQRVCEKHGGFEATHIYGSHWTGCPECQRERDEEDRRRQEENARQELASRKRELLRESGIQGRYLDASFDNFTATTKDQRRVLQACREFVATFDRERGGGLWLIGPPGVGKTHLGAAICRAVIEQHAKRARIASAREIVRRLRDTWRRGSEETEAAVIEELGGLSLLVIDEVGAGFGSEAEQVQLFDVLDLRYTLKRPTVLLSNLNQPLLRTALGDRSYDRLREGATVLVLNWASHRGARTGD
jgi:DNA replication protein DnaC